MKRLLYILAIITLFCSCSKEDHGSTEQNSGTITMTSGTELSFAGDATAGKTISFTAGSAWNASSNAAWCKLSTASGGEGSATITVTVDKNQTDDARNATITISTKDASANVTVKQGVIYIMDFSENTYLIPSTGDTIKVNLATNIDYEYSIPEDCNWIKAVTKTKALENHTLYFFIEPNDTYDTRDGKIDFINKDNRESQSITISQLQKDAVIPADTLYKISAQSQTMEFGISSNVDYELETDAAWIKIGQTQTKGLINKNITLEIEENSGFEARTGIITIKYKDIIQKVEIIKLSWAHRWTVSVVHNEDNFTNPEFKGRYIGGIVEWGDGKSDTYKTNFVHGYGNNAEKTAIYNLYATEMYSFEIPVINSIKSIKIVYKEEEK